jgi:hypothetical protein
MKPRQMLLLSGLVSLALVSLALAQPIGSGWVRVEDYDELFNPQTVQTLKGEVLSVDTFSPGKGHRVLTTQVTMRLKTDKETIEVYLGPKPYIDKQKVKLALNDRVMVKGSRVSYEGKPLIIATGVRKGRQFIKLRDRQGKPRWRGKGAKQ